MGPVGRATRELAWICPQVESPTEATRPSVPSALRPSLVGSTPGAQHRTGPGEPHLRRAIYLLRRYSESHISLGDGHADPRSIADCARRSIPRLRTDHAAQGRTQLFRLNRA